MNEGSVLEALALRVEQATAHDVERDEQVHEALGWRRRKVTSLGMNGRTAGRWLWFPPNAPLGHSGRYVLPSTFGARNGPKYAAALRAASRQSCEEGEGRG